jgi:hypothetical protein
VPIIGGRMVFKVYDEDTIKDEIIGSINYDLKDVIPDANGKEGRLNNKFDWKNIYGAPLDHSGKWCDKMNNNPEVATLWKGRILVQVVAEKSEKPLLKMEKLSEDVIEDSKDCWSTRKYALRCYFYGALCVPENDKKYGISLRIADKDWTMWEPATSKKRYNRYNSIVTEDLKDAKKNESLQYYESPYMSIDDIGTIFFYLHYKTKLGGWKRICYWKGSIKKFTDPNAKLQWIEMNPDLAIGEVKKPYLAGVIGVKFSIHDVTSKGEIDWKQVPAWAGKLHRRPPNMKVRVYCWQARDLPAADESGSADPFIKICDSDKEQVT